MNKVIILSIIWVLGCGSSFPSKGNLDGGLCVDKDKDGYGKGCPRGEDCDDNDPNTHPNAKEICDRKDQNCNGKIDEGLDDDGDGYGKTGKEGCRFSEKDCDDTTPARRPRGREICDCLDNDCNGIKDDIKGEARCCGCEKPRCQILELGKGDFKLDSLNSQDLENTPEGSLKLKSISQATAHYAWIANHLEGTVSKIDLDTAIEKGRYKIGLEEVKHNDPSRTAVDKTGNVYIAARACDALRRKCEQGSLTKISAEVDYEKKTCHDRDLSGDYQTSEGPGDVLPLGEDECVLWRVPIGPSGAIPRALAVDLGDEARPEGYPWVGTWFSDPNDPKKRGIGRFYKLDPKTGEILTPKGIEVPLNPYGAAIDKQGRLWATGWKTPALVYIDTKTEEVVPILEEKPKDLCPQPQTYGIAIDEHGYVWTGGWKCEIVYRFNPDTHEWTSVDTRGRGLTRGIASDRSGNIWVAHFEKTSNHIPGISRIPSYLPGPIIHFKETEFIPLPSGTKGPVGIGVDFRFRIWVVNLLSNNLTRYDPLKKEFIVVPVGQGPYTYSDFTGYQLLTTLASEGRYSKIYKGCDSLLTKWDELSWEAEVPPGTKLKFQVQVAQRQEELDQAPLITIAEVPPATSPLKDIQGILEAKEISPGNILKLTIVFIADQSAQRSPILRKISLSWLCNEPAPE